MDEGGETKSTTYSYVAYDNTDGIDDGKPNSNSPVALLFYNDLISEKFSLQPGFRIHLAELLPSTNEGNESVAIGIKNPELSGFNSDFKAEFKGGFVNIAANSTDGTIQGIGKAFPLGSFEGLIQAPAPVSAVALLPLCSLVLLLRRFQPLFTRNRETETA